MKPYCTSKINQTRRHIPALKVILWWHFTFQFGSVPVSIVVGHRMLITRQCTTDPTLSIFPGHNRYITRSVNQNAGPASTEQTRPGKLSNHNPSRSRTRQLRHMVNLRTLKLVITSRCGSRCTMHTNHLNPLLNPKTAPLPALAPEQLGWQHICFIHFTFIANDRCLVPHTKGEHCWVVGTPLPIPNSATSTIRQIAPCLSRPRLQPHKQPRFVLGRETSIPNHLHSSLAVCC